MREHEAQIQSVDEENKRLNGLIANLLEDKNNLKTRLEEKDAELIEVKKAFGKREGSVREGDGRRGGGGRGGGRSEGK